MLCARDSKGRAQPSIRESLAAPNQAELHGCGGDHRHWQADNLDLMVNPLHFSDHVFDQTIDIICPSNINSILDLAADPFFSKDIH
jgi:hypothetical protein